MRSPRHRNPCRARSLQIRRSVGTHPHRLRQATKIIIAMSDDGGGLNAERIERRVKSLGFIAASAETVDDAHLYDLIFQPGFSDRRRSHPDRRPRRRYGRGQDGSEQPWRANRNRHYPRTGTHSDSPAAHSRRHPTLLLQAGAPSISQFLDHDRAGPELKEEGSRRLARTRRCRIAWQPISCRTCSGILGPAGKPASLLGDPDARFPAGGGPGGRVKGNQEVVVQNIGAGSPA